MSQHTVTKHTSLQNFLLTLCSITLLLLGSQTLASSERSKCHHDNMASKYLMGKRIIFNIQEVAATDASAYPSKGVIVRNYESYGEFSSVRVGGGEETSGEGHYRYKRNGYNKALEHGRSSLFNHQRYTLHYSFSKGKAGQWTMDFQNGDSLKGQFSIEPIAVPSEEQFAPSSHANMSIALTINHTVSPLPPEAYPTQGVVIQSYLEDNSYTGLGFGPATVDHWGTYSYQKVSANVAVEETIQNTDFFTLPYTMVYTYETPNSGTWYQNFGDGLILFSGNFTTFPTH